jgi:DNA repair protein RadC
VDARGKLLLDDVLAMGSLTTSTVHPRDVFVPALECAATAVILAHNHPSGDPKPSPEDIHLTKQLKEAGQLMGIDLVDHIIISGSSFVSMSDLKLL